MAVTFLNKDLKFGLRKNNPFLIQFDINNNCNLACSHCYHQNHSNDSMINLPPIAPFSANPKSINIL